MSTTRKAVTVFPDDFDACTYLKPLSDEYLNFLIVICEDAHGELTMNIKPIDELKKNFRGEEEEFQEILKELGV